MKYSDKSLYFCKFRKFHLGAWGPSNNSFLNTFGRKNKGWVILITAHHEGRRPIRTSIYYAELYNKVLKLIMFPSETRQKFELENKRTGNLSSQYLRHYSLHWNTCNKLEQNLKKIYITNEKVTWKIQTEGCNGTSMYFALNYALLNWISKFLWDHSKKTTRTNITSRKQTL